MNDEKNDDAALLPVDPLAPPPTTEALTSKNLRYCHACDEFMKARECKACGMPTERVPA